MRICVILIILTCWCCLAASGDKKDIPSHGPPPPPPPPFGPPPNLGPQTPIPPHPTHTPFGSTGGGGILTNHSNPFRAYERCPKPFVAFSGHPSHHRIRMPESNCVMPCRSPIWTYEEWESLSIISRVSSALGTALALFSIFSRLTHPKYCFQNSVLILLISSAVLSTGNFIVSMIDSSNQCFDDSAPLVSRDGPTACAAQSILMLYTLLVGCLAWTLQAVTLMIRVVHDVDITKKFEVTNFLIVLGLPLIPVVIVLAQGSYGFSGVCPWCTPLTTDYRLLQNLNSQSDLMALYIPAAVIIVIGICMLIPIGWMVISTVSESYRIDSEKSLKSSRSATTQVSSNQVLPASTEDEEDLTGTGQSTISLCSAAPLLQIIFTPLLFCLPFLLFWLSFFGLRLRLQSMKVDNAFDTVILPWWQCILSNYDGISDASWHGLCGNAPRIGISFHSMAWVTFCFYGHSFFICVVHPPVLRLVEFFSRPKEEPVQVRRKPNPADIAKRQSAASQILGMLLNGGSLAGGIRDRDRAISRMTSRPAADDEAFEDFEFADEERNGSIQPSVHTGSRRLFSFFQGNTSSVVPGPYETNSAKLELSRGHAVAGSVDSSDFVRLGSNDEGDRSASARINGHTSGNVSGHKIDRMDSHHRRQLAPKRSGKFATAKEKEKEKVHSEFEQQVSEIVEDPSEMIIGPRIIPSGETSHFQAGSPIANNIPCVMRKTSNDLLVSRSISGMNFAGRTLSGASSGLGDSTPIRSHLSLSSQISRDESDLVHVQFGTSMKSDLMLRLDEHVD